MLPQYEQLESRRSSYISVDFGKFAVIVVLFPFLSFCFCVLWSVLFFFEDSTSTHCHVRNYLPSISAAIGNYQPQRFVWQLAICLHTLPRFVVTVIYLQYYIEKLRKWLRPVAYLACFLNFIENWALLALTLWTSIDDYEIHKLSFVTFIAMSELYMMISFVLQRSRMHSAITKIEAKSLIYKQNLCVINIVSFGIAGYFFLRHNSHCEPGVYTLFAIFEYIVVMSNMGFHMTAYWDFYRRKIVFDLSGRVYLSNI